jgi:phage shock protein PspC (stress-responsive transcriptional regulator)
MIGGVLGGSARALGLSPVVTRMTAVAAAIAVPVPSLVAYVVVALVLRDDRGCGLLAVGAGRRDALVGWAGVVGTFLLVTGAAVGGAPLLFAHTEPLTLVLATGAALTVVARADPIRRRTSPAPRGARGDGRSRALLAWTTCAAVVVVSVGMVLGRPAGAVLGSVAVVAGGAVALCPGARHSGLLLATGVACAWGAWVAVGLDGVDRAAIGRSELRPEAILPGTTTYELGVGDFTVDLRRTRLPHASAAVEARVDIGRVVVLLSSERQKVQVQARSRVGVADVRIQATR